MYIIERSGCLLKVKLFSGQAFNKTRWLPMFRYFELVNLTKIKFCHPANGMKKTLTFSKRNFGRILDVEENMANSSISTELLGEY